MGQAKKLLYSKNHTNRGRVKPRPYCIHYRPLIIGDVLWVIGGRIGETENDTYSGDVTSGNIDIFFQMGTK